MLRGRSTTGAARAETADTVSVLHEGMDHDAPVGAGHMEEAVARPTVGNDTDCVQWIQLYRARLERRPVVRVISWCLQRLISSPLASTLSVLVSDVHAPGNLRRSTTAHALLLLQSAATTTAALPGPS